MNRFKRIAMVCALTPVLMLPTQVAAGETAKTTLGGLENPIYHTMFNLGCKDGVFKIWCP